MKLKKITALTLLTISTISIIGCSPKVQIPENNTKPSAIEKDTEKEEVSKNESDKNDSKKPTSQVPQGLKDPKPNEKPNNNNSKPSSTNGSFVHKGNGYELSLDIPTNWAKLEVPVGEFAFLIDSTGNNFNVVREYAQGYSFDDYMDISTKYLNEDSSVSHFQSDDMKIGDKDARISRYVMTTSGVSIELYQICVFQDGYAYILTFACTNDTMDSQIPAFQKIAKTLQIK